MAQLSSLGPEIADDTEWGTKIGFIGTGPAARLRAGESTEPARVTTYTDMCKLNIWSRTGMALRVV